MRAYRELEVKLHVLLALGNPLYDTMVLWLGGREMGECDSRSSRDKG